MAVNAQNLTDRWALYNADCHDAMKALPDGKIHLSIYSPPFATTRGGLYTYSSSERDLSNARDYGEFFEHYAYTVEEIHRLTMPGRHTAVHCMPVPSGNTGKDCQFDFPGDIIRLHTRCREPKCTAPEIMRAQGMCGHGWFEQVAEYYVWKEPLEVRNRTLKKGLAHRTIIDDSSRCCNAVADKLLVFRRAGENPIPIAHPTGLMEYAGARKMPADLLRFRGWTGDQKLNKYSHWIWRRYADAFWDDIRLDRVLPYREAKDVEDEKHVHPLQLDVIHRACVLWSNPGETVLSPYAGVGSEVYESVRLGRRGVGIELKPSYYRQAVANLGTVDVPQVEQVTIADALGERGETVAA
ncbi:MAG TPA: DNA methyltransferase [Longimicrobiaceae bacterium]|nr:DNA methyltransferase [Longimicrobiaceae bacterium]